MATLDECLDRCSPALRGSIEQLIERAGTSDADWEVLKEAGLERLELERGAADIAAENKRAHDRIRELEAERDGWKGVAEGFEMRAVEAGELHVAVLTKERDTLSREVELLRAEIIQLQRDALPDPHDERDVSLAWLRSRIREAAARTTLTPEKADDGQAIIRIGNRSYKVGRDSNGRVTYASLDPADD